MPTYAAPCVLHGIHQPRGAPLARVDLGLHRLAFTADCAELLALTSTRRLDRYELKNGQLVQQVSALRQHCRGSVVSSVGPIA